MDFLNNNYKTFLNPNEKILLHTTQAKNFRILYVILHFILAFAIINFLYFLALTDLKSKLSFSIQPSIYFGLFIAFISYIQYKGIHYIITENGIYKVFGILNKKIKFVPYKKITDSSLSINFFESMFNVGTINISTAGGTKSYRGNSQPYEIVIKHIDDYNKTNQLITKYL